MFSRLYEYWQISRAKSLLAGFLFLFFSCNLAAQNFSTLSLGANFSDFVGFQSETFDLKRGYYMGLGYHTLFSDPFSFGVELNMNRKGFSQ